MIWGIIFVFININIGPIDILPNFLGYIFIACGLSGLEQVDSIYKKGIMTSLVLAFASFILLFYPINISQENISPSNCWMLGISAAFSVLNLVIFYTICKFIYTKAEKNANDASENVASTNDVSINDISTNDVSTNNASTDDAGKNDVSTNVELMRSAKTRWNCMLYFTCINLGLTPFTLNMGQRIKIINFLISIILIILAILIVALLIKARSEFCEENS